MLYFLNKLDHKKAYTVNDPRLRTVFGDYLKLDTDPLVAATSVPYQLGYKPYTLISGGDIVYYLNSEINVAHPPIVFGNNVTTQWTRAPLTPFKNLVIPIGVVSPDLTIINNDMRNEATFRTDLMARQQIGNNRTRPLII